MTEPMGVRKILGWVPDSMGFYDTLTTTEYLAFAGSARRLSMAAARARAVELLDLVHLAEFGDRQVHVLSRGQKQRLGVASALVHRPRVLILDEPAAGLDPASRVDFLRLVRRLAADGAAVIISSHLLSDLEQMADRVVFIDHGVNVGERRVGEPQPGTAIRQWRIHSLHDAHLHEALRVLGMAAADTGNGGMEISLESDESAAAVLAALIGQGVAVVSFAPISTSLEAAYFELTEPQ